MKFLFRFCLLVSCLSSAFCVSLIGSPDIVTPATFCLLSTWGMLFITVISPKAGS